MAPVGRPSKYMPTYCDQVIEHMTEGASILSFAAEIGVSRATITVWMEEHPEFLAAVSIGKAKCASWWERVARANAQNGGGNATLTVFGLKNMGDGEWSDKTEQTVNATVIATVQTVERKIVRPNPVDPNG